jgi:hypothetical protein
LATGSYPLSLVVPGGEERSICGNREIGLPLRLGGIAVSIEHQRGAEGLALVGGTDIEDVARVAVPSVAGGIDIVNHAVVGRRLTPALVSPVERVVEHAGKEARSTAARPREAGAYVRVSPGVTAVGRSVDAIRPVAKAATHLIHRGDVHVACDQVASDLHVAEESVGDLSLIGPGDTVVSGVADKNALAASEVVPGNVHPPKEGRRCVIVGPARLAVV